MTKGQNNTFDETPYRAFLYEFFGDFFRGCHDDAWRARWQDVMTVTNALTDEMQSKVLPDATTLAQAFARAFYGVGSETVPLAQSCWDNAQALHCGKACRAAHDIYARHGMVNDCANHLPDDHIGITLPFAALLLRQGELDDLRQLVDSIALRWPQAEAQLRKGNEWSVLEPVLTTFARFINYETQLLKVS